MAHPSVTRGHGLLEAFLARRRAAMANRLIPSQARHGRLLDVGCGSFPYFLTRTEFAEKLGVDKMVRPDDPDASRHGVQLAYFDIDTHDRLPFDDQAFDAVTMLAVFEHIRKDRLVLLIDEIERVLKPGGNFVMTTPAGWTGPILRLMTLLRLVSADEIDEHQDSYSIAAIRHVIARTRFSGAEMRFGHFECFMNIWGVIRK